LLKGFAAIVEANIHRACATFGFDRKPKNRKNVGAELLFSYNTYLASHSDYMYEYYLIVKKLDEEAGMYGVSIIFRKSKLLLIAIFIYLSVYLEILFMLFLIHILTTY
jgi:hypothetical protein